MGDLDDSLFDELKMYAEKAYTAELTAILMADNFCQHHSIHIDTMSLLSSSVLFAHHLFECPEKALKLLNNAFQEAALEICRIRNMKSTVALKGNIHVRLTALPNIPEIHRTNLPDCSDNGQFMCISGTIIRGTTSKMLEYRKLWKCKKCKYEFTVDGEVEYGYICEKPMVCPNPEWCNAKNFTLLSTNVDPSYCKDYQEVKLQEQVYNLTVGSVPKSMWVILEDDLVETCHPGNDVNVSGILIQRWKPLVKGRFMDIDLVLLAHNVEVKNRMIPGVVSENMVQEFGQFWIDHENDPLKGRDIILSSICPQVFGLYTVKLAVALILAGGVEKKDANSRIRGDSHLLLVGDPGTGKSQFLKYASKVSVRSVITSGIGTTNAGLTVSAVKEGGKWQLEAGALVLADGGVCCIDEFSCIKEHDKTCIHEAMEQQTISVAKAGLVCSLSTRCSILAATNPKGKYDDSLSISENTALASPLLSRFDIILVLLDTCDEKWDRLVSSFILEGRNLSVKICNKLTWSLEKMRNYFSLIRYISPKVTPSCEKILQAYYRRQRCMESKNFARTTPRLLQSLIRLAEGHARLMFRDQVLVIDAVMAIILMESSMSGSSVLKEFTSLHTSFPENPKDDYDGIEKSVLKLLNLDTISIDSGNYVFSYEDSYVKKLISQMSIVCKSSKKLDLFGNSESGEFSNINSVSRLTQKCDDIAMKSARDTDQLKNFVGRDKDSSSTTNNLTNETGDFSSFQIPNLPCNITTVDTVFQTEECEEVQHNRPSLRKDNSNRLELLRDEVSTLSDLRNIFSDNLVESEDIGESYVQNTIKQKLKNKRSLNDLFEVSQRNASSDSSTNLKHNGVSDRNILKESTSHITEKNTANSPSTSKLKSLKRFSFQQSKRSKTDVQSNLSIENLNGANSNTNINSVTVIDIPNDPITESKSSGVPRLTETTSSYFEVAKTIPITTPTESARSCFQNDVTNIISDPKCKSSTSGGCGEKKTTGNRFQKFSFQTRPSKNKDSSISEQKSDGNMPSVSDGNPEELDRNATSSLNYMQTSQSSISENKLDTNIPSVSKENSEAFNRNARSSLSYTQPSQSVFKRIFSSFVQNTDPLDLDFDGPLF